MARVLTLQYKDVEIPVILKGFSRDILYGKSIIERRGEDGTVFQQTNLTVDGTQILAKLGLQRTAKEEQLFSTDDWSDPQNKDYLIERLTTFLIRHIR